MYSDSSGLTGIRVVISISSILLVASLALAFFTLRPHRRHHLRVAWYSVSLATLCLIGQHATALVVAGTIWHRGPGELLPYAWAQYHVYTYREMGLYKPLVVFNGLASALVIVACRAAFWEITGQHPVFKRHNNGRWITLAFDLLVGLSGFAMWMTAVVQGQPCCEGSLQSTADLLIGSVFDEVFSYGFPYIIVLGYINASVSAFFARKWARQYNLGVPIANAMFAFVWPMLLIQTLLLIVATVVYFAPIDNDLSVYCAMIPWRVQQIAIVCVLAWVIRTRPLNVDGTQSPATKQLTPQIIVT